MRCRSAVYYLCMSWPIVSPAIHEHKPLSSYFLMSTVFCLSAIIAAGLFLSWTLYLVPCLFLFSARSSCVDVLLVPVAMQACTNQTTIEFYTNKFDAMRQRNTVRVSMTECITFHRCTL